jgi:drug/metabolite transporter (DMT)-like permease
MIPQHAQHPVRGALYIGAAVFLFASMDVLAKIIARGDYPVPVALWARYFVHMLFMVIVLGPRVGLDLVRTQRPGLQILRGLLLAGSTLFFYSSLKFLPLAEAAAISFVAPLMVVAFSGPILHEKVTRGQWLAVLAGFVGVLIVVHPGAALMHLATLLPLATAFFYSLYQVFTRKLAGRENPLTSLFYTALVGASVASLALPFTWKTPTLTQGMMLMCIGLIGGFGHFLLIKAMHYAAPSALAPVIYSQLVWANIYSMIVFNDYPDAMSVVGMVIIVVAGLYAANWRWKRKVATN